MSLARPRYETAQDGRNEAEVGQIVARHLGLDVIYKLPDRSYGLDFFALLGQSDEQIRELIGGKRRTPSVGGVAFVEVKCRSRVYPGFTVSVLKTTKCFLFEQVGVPSYIAFAVAEEGRWNVFLWRWRKPTRTVWAGRVDRRDLSDEEPQSVIEIQDCENFTAERP